MKMSIRIPILLVLFLCLGQSIAYGQQYISKAKVVIVNREVLRGYLFEPWTGGNISLKITGKTSVEIDSADIKKVKLVGLKGSQTYNNVTSRSRNGEFGKKEGFYHQIYTGLSFGEIDVNPSIGMINGYRFNQLFALGLGVSYDRFASAAALPVYLQSRLYIKNDKTSLFYFTDVGYGAAWQNRERSSDWEQIKTTGGLMGQAGIGYQINFSKSALNFTLGYKLQKMKTHAEYYSYPYDPFGNLKDTAPSKFREIEERRLIRRVAFTVGYTL